MATKRKPTPGPAARKPPRGRIPVFAIVLGGIVLIGVVAVVLTVGGGGGSDHDKSTSAAGVKQTQPVEVAGTTLPEAPKSGADPGVGMTIPDVRGASFDGTSVDIVKDGTAKVIVFAAHWCPHCQKELPIIADYLKTHPMPPEVKLLTMSTSVNADAPNYP